MRLGLEGDGPLRVLCLGAHCDDIEIGCGGTLLHLQEARPGLDIRWLVFCSDPRRAQEARESAAGFLGAGAGERLTIHGFRDGFLPWQGDAAKEALEAAKAAVDPDLIFTHARHDLHQDHRLVSDLTWQTFRRHLILEYEIPKWDGDLGTPNSYVPLEERHVARKAETLLKAYGSQRGKGWFDADLFRGLMRMRGVEAGAPSRFAEAFYARKLILDPAA